MVTFSDLILCGMFDPDRNLVTKQAMLKVLQDTEGKKPLP